MPLCPDCKFEVGEGDFYCRKCGAGLGHAPQGAMVYKFMRGLSTLFGTLFLVFSLSAGFPYYLESGLPQVLLFEAMSFMVATVLVLLGLAPDFLAENLGPRIRLRENYIEVVSALIIVLVLIAAVEPAPSSGWIGYN